MAEIALKSHMKLLKREVKRAKLFGIQRLVRRLRQLANKKGTDVQLQKNRRKIERLEKELEIMKDATFDEICEVLKRKDKVSPQTDDVEEQHNLDELRTRALDKIAMSKTLQTFLERLSKDRSSPSAETDAAKKQQRGTRKTKSNKWESATASKGLSRERDEHKLRQTDRKGNFLLSSNPAVSIGSDSIGDSSEAFDRAGKKGLESCFLSALSASRNGKSHKASKRMGKLFEKGGTKNRMGQRARQEMYEKIYGKDAKHLQKNKHGFKEENRAPKQLKEVDKKSIGEQAKQVEVLHPSWEATRKRRLQETGKVEFKGQKIKFSEDSE